MSLWTQPHRTPTRPGRRAGIPAMVLMVLVILVLIGTIAVAALRGDPEPAAPDSGLGKAQGGAADGARGRVALPRDRRPQRRELDVAEPPGRRHRATVTVRVAVRPPAVRRQR